MTVRIAVTVGMLAWAAGAAAVTPAPPPGLVRVQVCEEQTRSVILDGMLLSGTQSRASQLLAEAGIRLEWGCGKPGKSESQPAIRLKFVPSAPDGLSGQHDALAAATLYKTGGSILVFDDRVTFYLWFLTWTDRWKVLGHILAHEIVHVLEGIPRHSETGLMKACWSTQDLRSMEGEGLHLANEDQKLLRTQFLRTFDDMYSPSSKRSQDDDDSVQPARGHLMLQAER